MDLAASFVVYLLVFRLAIVAAGVVSVVLGYLLFVTGVWSGPGHASGAASGSELEARAGGYRLTIRNAAPGTCFALFGAAIISTMLVQGRPELVLRNLSQLPESGIQSTELQMRGDRQDAVRMATQRGLQFEEQQNAGGAIAAYEEALAILAAPMNNLAWLYLKDRRPVDALPMSRVAVALTPLNANHLDTLAEVLHELGEHPEALSVGERAAKLDARFADKLPKYKTAAARE